MPIQESLHDILISATARSLALSLSLVKLSTLNSPCRGHLHADRGEEPLAYKHSPQREQSFGWRGAGLPLVLCPRPLHFLVSDCSRSDRQSVERIFFWPSASAAKLCGHQTAAFRLPGLISALACAHPPLSHTGSLAASVSVGFFPSKHLPH